MKKIPTLFVRGLHDRRHVTPEVTPGCEWVLAGEGTATRKWDGTCVMYDGERWWARREVKPQGRFPEGFVELDHDEVTGKTVGWEPAEQSGFARYIEEAGAPWLASGTYELIGPQVNGNPEAVPTNMLVRHGATELVTAPRTFEELRDWLLAHGFEGIVWHHPDGRMAKLKRRDFASEAPPPAWAGRGPGPRVERRSPDAPR